MTKYCNSKSNNYFSRNKAYHKKRDKRYNNKQKPSIPEKYLELLNVQWPNASVLSNNILLSNSLDVFNYTEKIDGLHTFLLIFKKKNI